MVRLALVIGLLMPVAGYAFLDLLAGAAIDFAAQKATEAVADKIVKSPFMGMLYPAKVDPGLRAKPKKILDSVGTSANGAQECSKLAKWNGEEVAKVFHALPEAAVDIDSVRVAFHNGKAMEIYWIQKAKLAESLRQAKPLLEGEGVVVGDLYRAFPLKVKDCHWLIPTLPSVDIEAKNRYTRVTEKELDALFGQFGKDDDYVWIPDAQGVFEASRGDSPEAKIQAEDSDREALVSTGVFLAFGDRRYMEKMSDKDFYWNKPRAKSKMPAELVGTWGDGKGFKMKITADKHLQFLEGSELKKPVECMVMVPKKKPYKVLAFLAMEGAPPTTWEVELKEGKLELDLSSGRKVLSQI